MGPKTLLHAFMECCCLFKTGSYDRVTQSSPRHDPRSSQSIFSKHIDPTSGWHPRDLAMAHIITSGTGFQLRKLEGHRPLNHRKLASPVHAPRLPSCPCSICSQHAQLASTQEEELPLTSRQHPCWQRQASGNSPELEQRGLGEEQWCEAFF